MKFISTAAQVALFSLALLLVSLVQVVKAQETPEALYGISMEQAGELVTIASAFGAMQFCTTQIADPDPAWFMIGRSAFMMSQQMVRSHHTNAERMWNAMKNVANASRQNGIWMRANEDQPEDLLIFQLSRDNCDISAKFLTVAMQTGILQTGLPPKGNDA